MEREQKKTQTKKKFKEDEKQKGNGKESRWQKRNMKRIVEANVMDIKNRHIYIY